LAIRQIAGAAAAETTMDSARCYAGAMSTLRFWIPWVLSTVAFAPQARGAAASVMVLYFDNNTGNSELEHLGKGLADMMITDLSAVPSLQVVERDRLEALLRELRLQRSKYFDPKTAQRLGKGLGARFAVMGAFIAIEPNIRLDVRVVRIDSGTVVKGAMVTGRKDDFFGLQQQLGAKLIEGLAEVVPSDDAKQLTQATARNRVGKLSALAEYGRGLDASDRGDLSGASKHIGKVVRDEPGFALGKDRYAAIMKALYRAKDQRATLLSDGERKLLANMDAVLAKKDTKSLQHLAYRVLRGQYHLTRATKAANEKKAPATYRDHIKTYVDNTVQLFEETKDMPDYRTDEGLSRHSEADKKAAEDIGVKQPGSTFGMRTPAAMLLEMNNAVMFNDPSVFVARLDADDVPCFFLLDPSIGPTVVRAYENAWRTSPASRKTTRNARPCAPCNPTPKPWPYSVAARKESPSCNGAWTSTRRRTSSKTPKNCCARSWTKPSTWGASTRGKR
jgi:TolB-like protein